MLTLDGINFERTIMSGLKIKSTISLNLHFNEKFPMNFWKYDQPITIKDSFLRMLAKQKEYP